MSEKEFFQYNYILSINIVWNHYPTPMLDYQGLSDLNSLVNLQAR